MGKLSDECAAVAGGLRLQIKYMPGFRLRANRLRTTQFAAFPLLHLTGFGAPVQDANDSAAPTHAGDCQVINFRAASAMPSGDMP